MRSTRSAHRGRMLAATVAGAVILAVAGCASEQENTQTGGVVGLTDTGGPKVTAGDCAGFQNGVGVTDDKITIANASDISGLVPGLFKDAQLAVQAYVEYFNAGQDICGRKLEYLPLDSRIDAAGDQAAATEACSKAFAMIGSMAAFDNGGAKAVEQCGIPDLRTASVTPARNASPVSFATNSVAVNLVPAAVPDYMAKKYPEAVKKAAFLYLNAGSALDNGKSYIKAYSKRGFNFVYTQAIDPLDVNYTPYIQAMKSKGVEYVQFIGDYNSAVRLAKLMQTQQFKPEAYVLDPSGYDYKFTRLGGPAVEGTTVFTNGALFEEAQDNEEMRRYMGWLGKVAPNTQPTYFGMFAWAAARLFTEEAIKLGGQLNRETMVQALSKVNEYEGHGLFAPQNIGKRETAPCTAVIKLENGKWVRESGKDWLCGPLIPSSPR
jgi:ABC-type branched-subunit amino acid transport system substrate-binding protein